MAHHPETADEYARLIRRLPSFLDDHPEVGHALAVLKDRARYSEDDDGAIGRTVVASRELNEDDIKFIIIRVVFCLWSWCVATHDNLVMAARFSVDPALWLNS